MKRKILVVLIIFGMVFSGVSVDFVKGETQELYYDDGSDEFGFIWDPGTFGAVKFTVSEQSQILKLKYYAFGESSKMKVYVLDTNLNTLFSDKITFYEGWVVVDIQEYNIYVNGTFYVATEWISNQPFIGCDTTPPHHQRSYVGSVGNISSLTPARENEDYMIRCVVSSTTISPTTTPAPRSSKSTAGKHKISEEKLKILYDNYHCGGGIYEYSDLNLELSHRFTADSIDEPLTLEELSNYDILVISHPTLKYTSSEVRAIKEFVGEGGSLLLMGNGWAWADYNNKPMKDFPFNKIAKEFGVTVNDDIIGDPTNYHTPGDEGNTIFTNFAVHPVTEDLTKVYGGLCSSLSITGDAVPIVMGDEDSYSGYHPGPYKAGDYPPVVAALEYVKGRVIFIGKDGFITNEDLDKYDNLKFGMNIFTWLAGDMSTLHIDCLSGVATIYLGGKNLGETPVEVELEKGNYKVRVVKEGYEEYMFEISLKGGEKKNISVSLQKILGKLSIVSDPSATVYINEEKKGTTPLNLELDSGKYEIKIEKENYETYTETIELSSGEIKTISVNLTKITPAPTTTPALTTSAPTTSPPTTTAPPKQSNTLLYLGIAAVAIVILVLTIYQITKKESVKAKEPKKSSKKEIENRIKKLKEDYVEGKISREEYLRRKEELEK